MAFSSWKKPATPLAQGAFNFGLRQVDKPSHDLDLKPPAEFKALKRNMYLVEVVSGRSPNAP